MNFCIFGFQLFRPFCPKVKVRKECAFHSAVSMPASAIAFIATFALYSGTKGARAFLTCPKAKKTGVGAHPFEIIGKK